MVSFFRKNTAYKVIFLFLIFLAFRLPIMILGKDMILPELGWLLIGERLGKGYYLYTEIWDNISPLSALIYWFVYSLFGKSVLVLQILSSILIFIQALVFNQILSKRGVFTELTLTPAFLYLLLMSLFIDLYTLSPILIANTLILLVASRIFLQISEQKRQGVSSAFEVGVYFGLATLFYLPSVVLLILPLYTFIIFTNIKFREYALIFFAFFFTIGIAFLAFYLTNNEYDFYLNFFQASFYLDRNFYLSWSSLAYILAIPSILLVLALLRSTTYRRYSNYQNRCSHIASVWFFVALASAVLSTDISIFSFTFAIPPACFLLSHYFLNIKNFLFKEVTFAFLFASIVFSSYGTFLNTKIRIPLPWQDWESFTLEVVSEDLELQPIENKALLKGKKILVLGKNLSYYQNSSLATPYLNWDLAQKHFANLGKYYNINQSIYDNIIKDYPEIIVDEAKFASKLFHAFPIIAKTYRKLPKTIFYIKTE